MRAFQIPLQQVAGQVRPQRPARFTGMDGKLVASDLTNVIRARAMWGQLERIIEPEPVVLYVVVAVPPPARVDPRRQGYPTTSPGIPTLLEHVLQGCEDICWDKEVQIVEAHITKAYSNDPSIQVLYGPPGSDVSSAVTGLE